MISRLSQQSVNLKPDQRLTLPQIAQVVFMLVKEIALQTIRLSAVITGEGRVSHRGLEFYLMLAAIVTLSQPELFSLHGLIPVTRQDWLAV